MNHMPQLCTSRNRCRPNAHRVSSTSVWRLRDEAEEGQMLMLVHNGSTNLVPLSRRARPALRVLSMSYSGDALSLNTTHGC